MGRKGDVFVARLRYRGKEYKKSLKTTQLADAKSAMLGIERAIHYLTTGAYQVPVGVDPGDFIVSGGAVKEATKPRRRTYRLSGLIEEYLVNLGHKAASTAYTEGVHLRNLMKVLGSKAEAPAERIIHRDLEQYIQARLKERSPSTVDKERVTIVQLFRRAVRNGHLDASPAAGLAELKSDSERDKFRTIGEIETVLARGGLRQAEVAKIWDCLFLTEGKIASLPKTVRDRANADVTYLLHAIPAFTGMRRGEVLRLRWSDIDLDRGSITARSRKQSRQKQEVAREIELHPGLRLELMAWQSRRPHGQFVICQLESMAPLDGDQADRFFRQPMQGTPWCLISKKTASRLVFTLISNSSHET